MNVDLNTSSQKTTELFVETKKVTITERGVAAMEVLQSNANKQDAEVNTSKVRVPIQTGEINDQSNSALDKHVKSSPIAIQGQNSSNYKIPLATVGSANFNHHVLPSPRVG